LIRFLSNETGYLSQTCDGPRCSALERVLGNSFIVSGVHTSEIPAWDDHRQSNDLCASKSAATGCVPTLHCWRRMFVNIEDWVSRQTRQPNEPFLVRGPRSPLSSMRAMSRFSAGAHHETTHAFAQQVVELFMTSCNARFHWGKAGWSTFWPCFDGATVYPDTWCHFGCGVQVLGLPSQTLLSCVAAAAPKDGERTKSSPARQSTSFGCSAATPCAGTPYKHVCRIIDTPLDPVRCRENRLAVQTSSRRSLQARWLTPCSDAGSMSCGCAASGAGPWGQVRLAEHSVGVGSDPQWHACVLRDMLHC
jgi:hypothetical protein